MGQPESRPIKFAFGANGRRPLNHLISYGHYFTPQNRLQAG